MSQRGVFGVGDNERETMWVIDVKRTLIAVGRAADKGSP